MDSKRRRIRPGAVIMLAIGILLVGYSCAFVHNEPNLLEYMFHAGKVTASKDDDGAEAYQSDLDGQLKVFAKLPTLLEGAATAATMTGHAQSVDISNEYGRSITSPLIALGENAFDISPRFLLEGRLFYPGELKQGAFVMLVDEEFALALFQMTNVVGREVTLAEKTYRIVGVLRHNRRIGEAGEFSAYVPLKTVHQIGMQLDTITLSAIPIQNAGAMATFERAVQELSRSGTFYDSAREKTGATLLARLVSCGFIFSLLRYILRSLSQDAKQFKAYCTQRLEQVYMPHMIPAILWGMLWRFMVFACICAGAAATFVFLIQPVYVFTEYIPAVLVEPEEIIKTFWQVQSRNATGVVYRSVNAARMEYIAGLCQFGSILILYGLLRVRRLEGVKQP